MRVRVRTGAPSAGGSREMSRSIAPGQGVRVRVRGRGRGRGGVRGREGSRQTRGRLELL